MASNNLLHNDLFSSLISDIKTYTGNDPLLPWLQGIRKMRESLPPRLLREKLPRFLQKCTQTFENDRRYANELRYLRVWLQLMDFVDDPKAVLRTMEANRIGMKKSLFYQAYALYYEKMKNFKEAEKMYHLGVKNLAEPVDELQKSYEQFLHRMERHKKKKILQPGRKTNRPPAAGSIPLNCAQASGNDENTCRVKGGPTGTWLKDSLPETQHNCANFESKKILTRSSENEPPMKECDLTGVALNDPSLKKGVTGDFGCKSSFKQQESIEAESDEPRHFQSGDTVVVKFVDTAIVEKSNAEDARHHGLVEPTINTKEAMNAINDMFREPLEPAFVGRRSRKSQPKPDQSLNNGFQVFIDDNLGNGVRSSNQIWDDDFLQPQFIRSKTHEPLEVPLQIYVEDEESPQTKERIHEKEQNEVQILTEGATISSGHVNAFVFPSPNDCPSECSKELDVERLPQARHREDTVVYRFVGSTISDEPQVENVCHHGLVDPTINLKEAMEDINNMFGKPIEFARKTRPKKQVKALDRKKDCGEFLILPDDDLKHQLEKFQPCSSAKKESDLFEQTVCTKEAMDEINKMFGMPLDF
ncbi:unnamed protein product [Ilex paraguariensis]|uniref:BUB1 N-terminal domain-containing protein n=1 Tax=Ilex paraguariensis TaxID=185542 RepID=A0ABC8QSU0_9AQUA